MASAVSLGSATDCRRRLLCRRYVAVVVRRAHVPGHPPVRFALGFVGRGEWEAVGVWSSGESLWDDANAFVADLARRGLQHVRVLLTDDADFGEPVAALLPSTQWLDLSLSAVDALSATGTSQATDCRWGQTNRDTLPQQLRTTVKAVEGVVCMLETSLKSALRRRRVHLVVEPLADLVATELHRVEQVAILCRDGGSVRRFSPRQAVLSGEGTARLVRHP